jgi:hypothetical protein
VFTAKKIPITMLFGYTWHSILSVNLFSYTVKPVLNGPFIKRNLSYTEVFSGGGGGEAKEEKNMVWSFICMHLYGNMYL